VIGLDFALVVGMDAFHAGERSGCVTGVVDLGVVVERVAGVEYPVSAGVHRDRGVAAGVAGQVDQDDARGDVPQLRWCTRTGRLPVEFEQFRVDGDDRLGPVTAGAWVRRSGRVGWC
jgi:hypothetical protein